MPVSAVQHERGPRKRKSASAESSPTETRCKKEKTVVHKRTAQWREEQQRVSAGALMGQNIEVSRPAILATLNEPSYLASGLQKQAFHAGFIHR